MVVQSTLLSKQKAFLQWPSNKNDNRTDVLVEYFLWEKWRKSKFWRESRQFHNAEESYHKKKYYKIARRIWKSLRNVRLYVSG